MGYLELMLMNGDNSIAVCDLIKPQDIIVKGLNEIEEMHDAEYYYNKGEESYKNKKYNEALCWFRKALQIDPDHENALFSSGVCYIPSNCRLGFPMELYGIDESVCSKRAIKCLEKLIDLRKQAGLQPSDCTAFNNLGCAYGNIGEAKKGEEAYRTAVKLNNNDPLPQNNLGVVFLNRGSLDEAENFFTTALKANKDYLLTHYNFGLLYEKKNSTRTQSNGSGVSWTR
jgi:tetratricopeptide (TPR) repeat protein